VSAEPNPEGARRRRARLPQTGGAAPAEERPQPDQAAPNADRMAMPSSVESLLAVDDLQYVEAGDGTKQFIDSRAAAHPLN